ncbi:hypothetical protein wNi1_05190 [Wolbachia pipientis]|nr:hypothetical protein wHmt_05660 [Wolbachia pipientis]BDG77468.1 hypothetical protein wHmc_06000 [Wolbachia pipientis]
MKAEAEIVQRITATQDPGNTSDKFCFMFGNVKYSQDTIVKSKNSISKYLV